MNDNPQSQDPPEANNAAGAGCMAQLVRPLPLREDKRRIYTIHFNACSSDRPDMFYDKVRGLKNAVVACDTLMHGPSTLVPSRKSNTKAWVCANVRAPGAWDPSKTVNHAIAMYCNFDPDPVSARHHSELAAKHGLIFQTNVERMHPY